MSTPDAWKTTKKANGTPKTEKTGQTKPNIEPTSLFGGEFRAWGGGMFGGGGRMVPVFWPVVE